MSVTLTFGDQAENGVGMQQIGKKAEKGFTTDELKAIKEDLENEGYECEYVDLVRKARLLENDERLEVSRIAFRNLDAGVLVVRSGLSMLTGKNNFSNKLLSEQLALDWDKKCWMRGRVVNKRARFNLCFSAGESQEPLYEYKKGRIINYEEVPHLNLLKQKLPRILGEKAEGLPCEGNYYFDPEKTGIGFHGDTERKIVIAIRLDENYQSKPIVYKWFKKYTQISEPISIPLNHGDMYIMSEKAVGTD